MALKVIPKSDDFLPVYFKTTDPLGTDIGYPTPCMWYNRTTGSLFLLKSITLGVAKWVETAGSDSLPATTSTDPAINAAVTTAIIDNYSGTVITLTAGGNAQTLQSPTDVGIKKFVVVSNDTNGIFTIDINGITLSAGEAQWFIWDETAWIAITAIDAKDLSFTPAGDIVATNVQDAIEELDTEKVKRIVSVDTEITRFDGITGDIQGYSSNAPTISDAGNIQAPGGIGGGTVNTLTVTGGVNTFSLTKGSASLDIAAAVTLDIDKSLTIDGQATTITGAGQANTLTLNESLTVGDGESGTLTYSVASKTLTVEDTSVVNQDLTSDASPGFSTVDLTGITDTNIPYMQAGAAGFADSPLSYDGTNVKCTALSQIYGLLPSTKTDSYTVTTADLGKSLRMNAAGDKNFTLPSMGATEDGGRLTFIKQGAGKMTTTAVDADCIDDSSAAGTIYTETNYATLTLEYVHGMTRWVIISGNGTFVTT